MATSVSPADVSIAADIFEETCDECGFQSARWSRQDAIRSVELADRLVGLTIEDMPESNWLVRPEHVAQSIREQFNQLIDVIVRHWGCAEAMVASSGADLDASADAPTDDAPQLDRDDLNRDETVEALDRVVAGYGAYLRSVDEELWGNVLLVEGKERSLDWLVRHSCHELMHRAADTAHTRHALGDGVAPLAGTVASIHASKGGVPKPEIPSAEIDVGGLVGDAQAARQYHGRPWQALCLWSTEVVETWAAEGHPIFPGAAGENLSLSGLDWSQLRAGLIVEIGDMTARLSAPAVPCAKNRRWFSDRSERRLGHDVSPGRARWYASVLTPGRIDQGDAVVVRSDRSDPKEA